MKNPMGLLLFTLLLLLFLGSAPASGRDLKEIQSAGVLRHLGIPYANFVTGSDDGMDVEIIQGFARHLGVRYKYVPADWSTVVEDLIGKKITMVNGHPVLGEDRPIQGDLIANGFTLLPWREEVIDFSEPTFPSRIWLIARADSPLQPIHPSNNEATDVKNTRALMNNRKVLTLPKTCLDPGLYNLEADGATVIIYNGNLNEIGPYLINSDSEMSILDVPDALIALEKWPGKIKILGPISQNQLMGVGFPKNAPNLRNEFNAYFLEIVKNGTYEGLIKKYYPNVSYYFPDFFHKIESRYNRNDH